MVCVLLLAGAVRAFALTSFPSKTIGDELYYVRTAVHIAQGHGHLDRGLGGSKGHTIARAGARQTRNPDRPWPGHSG